MGRRPHSIQGTLSTTATAEWVVEFFDQPLSPNTNFRIFQVRDDGADGYLSARNRLLLWRSLWNIAVELDGALSEDLDTSGNSVDGMQSMVRDDTPGITHRQPRAWWEQLRDAAERLCEAVRIGELHEIQPRTVGEEALIALAVRDDHIDWARDSFEWTTPNGYSTLCRFVELLWQPHLDGIDEPSNEVHKGLGWETIALALGTRCSIVRRAMDSRRQPTRESEQGADVHTAVAVTRVPGLSVGD